MGDPNWSDTTRDDFFKVLGAIARRSEQLESARKWAKSRRLNVIEIDDVNDHLSNWSLDEGERYTDTDNEGRIFVDITGAGPFTISLYRDSGKTDKVAEATGVAAGSTATLTAQSGHKLNGTVDLAAGASADSGIEIKVEEDTPREWESGFPKAGPDENEGRLKRGIISHWTDNIETNLQADQRNWRNFLNQRFWLDYVWNKLGLEDAIRAEGVHDQDYTDTSGTGRVLDRRKGIIAALHDAMKDNTGGSGAITIQKNTITFGSVSADTDNTGKASFDSRTGEEHLLSGTARAVCTDETIGSEKVRVELRLDKELPDGRKTLEAELDVTIKEQFFDYPMGLKFTLKRTIDETGDDGNIFSNPSTTGETKDNTDAGKIYLRIENTGGGPDFEIKMFKSTTDRTNNSNELAVKTVSGSGSEAITLSGSGLSLTITVDKDAAATHLPSLGNKDDDIDLNLNPLKIGDAWEFTVTNDEKGNFQTFLAKWFQASINSDASPNVDDNFAQLTHIHAEAA